MILAVDSGANAGWAIFCPRNNSLAACGLKNIPKEFPAPVTRLVIERPHTGRTGARARDILTLAIRAGEVGGLWGYLTGISPEYIEPGKWKGQIPKKRCNALVEEKLSAQEIILLENIRPKSARHNVLDAVGIGLFCVGRFI